MLTSFDIFSPELEVKVQYENSRYHLFLRLKLPPKYVSHNIHINFKHRDLL